MIAISRSKLLMTTLVTLFPLAFCHVTKTPQNVAVYVGRRMFFECKTSNGSVVREWLLYRSSSDQTPKKIFNNWNESNPTHEDLRYGLNVNKHGSGELYLNDTQIEDAGIYTCTIDADHQLTDYRADLIVLESEPKCTRTESSDLRIKAECSVGFSGSWTPKMEWRHHPTGALFEEGSVFRNETDTDNYFNKTQVTSKLVVFVLKSGKGSPSVSCKTYFDRGNETYPPGSASNVPNLFYIWNSSVSDSKDATFEDTVSSQLNYQSFVIALACAAVLMIIGLLTYSIRRRNKKTSLPRQHADVTAHENSVVLYAQVNKKKSRPNADATASENSVVLYAQVNKRKSAPMATSSKEYPFYEECNMNFPDAISDIMSKESKHQNSAIPMDGTVYLDINKARAFCEPPIPRTAMFQKSEYVSVDHTGQPDTPFGRP